MPDTIFRCMCRNTQETAPLYITRCCPYYEALVQQYTIDPSFEPLAGPPAHILLLGPDVVHLSPPSHLTDNNVPYYIYKPSTYVHQDRKGACLARQRLLRPIQSTQLHSQNLKILVFLLASTDSTSNIS